MLETLFGSISTAATVMSISVGDFFICTAASLLLGALIAFAYTIKTRYTKSFTVTLALLPVIVQMIIMLVNGNLGAGVAVMGAFSLVRFRSVPGSAKEITSIFMAMAVGLATGMGYIGYAAVFSVIVCVVQLIFNITGLGDSSNDKKVLKITIPEGLNYTGAFDDLFRKYTQFSELISVKTTNMGSLFTLKYSVRFKPGANERDFLNELRCRNGNLEISCGNESAADIL